MRRMQVALGALVMAGGVALAWWATRPATRFVYGVVAAGPGEGLLLTRRNEDRATYFWIESVDGAGALRWSAELTPVEPDEALGFSSAAVDEARVVVLGRAPEGDVALAIDRATGAEVWRKTLPAAPTIDTRIGPSVVFDGPRVVLVRDLKGERGPEVRVDAAAAASGEMLWSYEPGGDGDVQVLAPGRVLVTSRNEVAVVLDGATGAEVSRVDRAWVRCPLATGALASTRDRLVILSADAPRELTVEPRWRASDGPCGEREGDVIVGGRTDDDAAVVLRLDAKTGATRWRVELGRSQVEPVLAIDGRLPRFVPVALYGGGAEGEGTELAVVDVDRGVVVRRAARSEHVEVVVTDARAYVWAQFRATLVGLDPATGAMATATVFTGIGANDLRRDDVQASGLWLYGMGWASPEALPWAHVDLTDGRVLRTSGEVQAREVEAEMRAALGG